MLTCEEAAEQLRLRKPLLLQSWFSLAPIDLVCFPPVCGASSFNPASPSSSSPQALLDLDGDRRVSRVEVVEVFKQMGAVGRRIGGLQVSGGPRGGPRLRGGISFSPVAQLRIHPTLPR